MIIKRDRNWLTFLIAGVWLINGLFCKVLNMAPRHQQIVAAIFDTPHADIITTIIGVLEILMSIWVLSGLYSRFNAIAQVILILSMNIIEFIVTPNLLLFGRLNLVIAILFAAVIYYNEFIITKKKPNVITN